MHEVKSENVVTAYPFDIYKDGADTLIDRKEPIIHINTLAQMMYRAYSQESLIPDTLLLVLDKYAIEGVGEAGLFEIDFQNNYLKKVEDLQGDLKEDLGEFRLGIVYKNSLSDGIESLRKTILLHGDLKDVLQNKKINSKELTIQWITE